MSEQPSYAIGIDVGATKIAALLISREGRIVIEEHTTTANRQGPDALVEQIAQIAGSLIPRAQGRLDGIGIGSPGLVDSKNGIVRTAVNLGWKEVPLAERVRALLGDQYPVRIGNDANAQILGEYYFGAARNADPAVFLNIGSGFGAGIFVNGDIVSGATFTAAEIGHLVIEEEGRLCPCGQYGCVETILSGHGLADEARSLLSKGERSVLSGPDAITPDRVFLAARAGDPIGRAVIDKAARTLGTVCALVIATINPATFVIGGGAGLAGFDLIVPNARLELRRRVLPQSYSRLEIVPSSVDSSALGAACLVWHAQKRL